MGMGESIILFGYIPGLIFVVSTLAWLSRQEEKSKKKSKVKVKWQ